jgi:hypothetical protein
MTTAQVTFAHATTATIPGWLSDRHLPCQGIGLRLDPGHHETQGFSWQDALVTLTANTGLGTAAALEVPVSELRRLARSLLDLAERADRESARQDYRADSWAADTNSNMFLQSA